MLVEYSSAHINAHVLFVKSVIHVMIILNENICEIRQKIPTLANS